MPQNGRTLNAGLVAFQGIRFIIAKILYFLLFSKWGSGPPAPLWICEFQVSWVGLLSVIVAFPAHTDSFFPYVS